MLYQSGVILLTFLLFSCSSASLIREPNKDAGPLDDVDKALIEEGIGLHEKGNYEGAIRVYDKAIARNPHNVEALYEKALSLMTFKKYDESYSMCLKAFEYRWTQINKIYLLAGTNLDLMKRSSEAVKIYEEGIRRYPDDLLLWYNIGVTFVGRKENDKAKRAFKRAMVIRPTHPSSHVALAGLFFDEGNRIPALLAYSRFLILEPNTNRSNFAMERLNILLGHGVTKDPLKKDHINIQINPNTPTNEGDFGTVELILSFKAALLMGEGKGSSEEQRLIDLYESICSGLQEGVEGGKTDGFVWKYYAPYFAEVKNKGYTAKLVDRMFYVRMKGVDEEFERWSGEYPWSKADTD